MGRDRRRPKAAFLYRECGQHGSDLEKKGVATTKKSAVSLFYLFYILWIKSALNSAGTYRTELMDPFGPLQMERVRQHEQGHFAITEVFTKVLRSELKSMYATIFSPIPNPNNPDRYRLIADELLRRRMMSRVIDLKDLMDKFQSTYHDLVPKEGTPELMGTIPELARILPRSEADPNCILEARVFPRNADNYRDKTDVCDNGVIRTITK